MRDCCSFKVEQFLSYFSILKQVQLIIVNEKSCFSKDSFLLFNAAYCNLQIWNYIISKQGGNLF